MPSGWVKSLQCKSRAFDDVYHSNGKLLMPSYSCRKSSQSVRDVIDTRPGRKTQKPDPNLRRLRSCRTESESIPPARNRRSSSTRTPDAAVPALTELPEGHPSRNVVEIIFHSSWSPHGFPGRVEMIFKVENGSRTVTRFEEYRDAVKSRACGGSCEEDARCLADGNEMMRFYPLGPILGSVNGCGGGAWAFPGCKGPSAAAAVCTFSGSGEAHARGGGGGGRWAMLICRVIAGRVAKKSGFGSDSVAGRDGELVVLDTRAVLPCFLVIFRV